MMMQYENSSLDLIEALSNAFGPSGFEDDVLAVLRRFGGSLGEFSEDSLRNLYLYRKENTGNKPILMLDAHSDEVGFLVHSVRPDGTLRVASLGGWDKFTLSSSPVLVRNALGQYIPGILASKPYLYMDAAQRSQGCPDISRMAVDIGAVSAAQAVEEFHIRPGEPVAPDTRFAFDATHGILRGKAFDCRLGCAAILEALRQLQGEELAFDIVAVFSAQEELGCRGARVAVNHVKPQIAFCFEGCPADDTLGAGDPPQTVLGKGPMLRFMDGSIVCSPRYQRYVLDLAERKSLLVQTAVRTAGANDAGIINTACDGIPAVVAGIPVRYTHSCNGLAYYGDFAATASLAVETLRALTAEDLRAF